MLNELQQKIRKAIPELNEDSEFTIYATYDTNDGEVFCAYYDQDKCRIDAKESGTGMQEITLFDNQIQLNHVLEYIKHENKFYKDDLNVVLSLWKLKSNLLSEQSEELMKFINEL